MYSENAIMISIIIFSSCDSCCKFNVIFWLSNSRSCSLLPYISRFPLFTSMVLPFFNSEISPPFSTPTARSAFVTFSFNSPPYVYTSLCHHKHGIRSPKTYLLKVETRLYKPYLIPLNLYSKILVYRKFFFFRQLKFIKT